MAKPTIIPLTTQQVMGSLPTDESISPAGGGYVFTIANPKCGDTTAFGVRVPAYRDPSHLAAWLYGFAAYNEMMTELQNEKEN